MRQPAGANHQHPLSDPVQEPANLRAEFCDPTARRQRSRGTVHRHRDDRLDRQVAEQIPNGLGERVIQSDVTTCRDIEPGRQQVFAQSACHRGRDIKVAGRVAAFGQNRSGQRDPEGGYNVSKRAAVVTAEHDHHVGIEALRAFGR